MPYSDDPLMDFEHHDREQAKRLEQLPKCGYCNEPIQDDYFFEINGEFVCEYCLDRFFKKNTEDFMK